MSSPSNAAVNVPSHVPSRVAAPAGPAERLLYESERTRVVRWQFASGAAVVFKHGLGPYAQQRMRNERSLLKRLAEGGVAGVPRLVDVTHIHQATAAGVALQEVPGVSLTQLRAGRPLPLPQALSVALQLARIVAAMHRCGVVHKDITATNLMVADEGRVLTLIDFDLAGTVAEDRPGFVHQSEIAGTLAYMAPEQTGRTGRAVDPRADLYAIGVTLYEALTGTLPFTDQDPLRLVQAHLTQIPRPAHTVQPAVPQVLSHILAKLLEKEPDSRYQSAEGLLHDLLRVEQVLAQSDAAVFPLGEHDFPPRLSAPSRLVGRETERDLLQTGYEEAQRGECPGVLVAGAAGVGKTALINELRPRVTAGHGAFVSGKFDQYRHDAASAILEALRALARLLLSASETELAPLRQRIVQALGSNAPLLAQQHEFKVLLGPGLGDSADVDGRQAGERLGRAMLDFLGAVASPQRPLVIVIDDLQWAPEPAIRFLDNAISADPVPGLLWVLAFRDAEVDAAHPLRAVLPRWERQMHRPLWVQLQNLPPADTGALVGSMLRLAPEAAARLVAGLGARSTGNPFDTVELVNALRNDGVLVHDGSGWCWDEVALRGHVGSGDVLELLAARIARLPQACQGLMATLACLGGEVEAELLQAAAGLGSDDLSGALAAALEDGLVTTERAAGLRLQFRHDRVQQTVYGRLTLAQRQTCHLGIARRLAGPSEWAARAAEQYLAACEALEEPSEQWRALELLRDTACHISLTNPAGAERMFAGALTLLERLPGQAQHHPLAALLHSRRHSAQYLLGRLDAADATYAALLLHCGDVLSLADAACVQIDSLSQRGRHAEAIDLGLAMLTQLGITPPTDEAAVLADVMKGMQAFDTWLAGLAHDDESGRPDADDPRVLKAAKLIFRVSTPCHMHRAFTLSAWLMLRNMQLWITHGPNAEMASSASGMPGLLIGMRRDFRSGRIALEHLRKVMQARGRETAGAFVQHMAAVMVAPWCEPLERVLERARLAREGLLRAGDHHSAGYNYYTSLTALVGCAPSLDSCTQELEEALAFNARTRNADGRATLRAYQHALQLLREGPDDSFDVAAHLENAGRLGMAEPLFHVYRALAAALLDEGPALQHHAAAGVPLRRLFQSVYLSALWHLLQGLSLARQVAAAPVDARADLLTQFDALHEWMAQRAADAPFNFAPWRDLLVAERAAAVSDLPAALLAYDQAISSAHADGRAWHGALITERAGRCHLSGGLTHSGRALMVDARRLYAGWGATEKLRRLDAEHEFLRVVAPVPSGPSSQSQIMSAASIDMLGIVRASQALSSQMSLDKLQNTVVELLAGLTGATQVMLALRQDDTWWVTPGGPGTESMSVAQAGEAGLFPLSAFRYVERTGEPLRVDDTTRDSRFAADPYFEALARCSLLVVPVQSQGMPLAMLLLENRLGRHAFTSERLEAVKMIASQLAVSLNNLQLYASLERKVSERTAALQAANEQLAQLSATDPLTGLFNRRRLQEVLQAECARALRARSPIGMVMIDIDFFKRYNDHYGHMGGDQVLRLVGTTLLSVLRAGSDLVARFGGEEFAMVLPETDLSGTYLVAERARRAVAALAEPHVGSEHGFVSISVGVVAFVPGAQGATVEDAWEAADAALYEAKRGGRNRVAASDLPAMCFELPAA